MLIEKIEVCERWKQYVHWHGVLIQAIIVALGKPDNVKSSEHLISGEIRKQLNNILPFKGVKITLVIGT